MTFGIFFGEVLFPNDKLHCFTGGVRLNKSAASGI
jgi:hypothetical protein